MTIELPERFEYQAGDGQVTVHNGIMEITSMPFGFDEIMYQLVYQQLRQLNERKCYYCGETLSDEELTLDHYYQKSCGGISIPINLKPCCKSCNIMKADFMPEQFKILKNTCRKARRNLRKKFSNRNTDAMKEVGLLIPKDWYQMKERMLCFLPTCSSHRIRGVSYRRVLEFYRMSGKICKPVVISKNKVVLDGASALLVTKELNEQPPLPVVTLENVIYNV